MADEQLLQTKKVMLFVVEGPSDETALALLMTRAFSASTVMFDVVHTDVTTKALREPELENKCCRDILRDQIVEELKRRPYEWDDLGRIVLLTDTDGAFISYEMVHQTDAEGTTYELECIKTNKKNGIQRRNSIKSASVKSLLSKGHLTKDGIKVDFSAYFMSRNLEHALHGIADECSDSDKEKLARQFQSRYKNDIAGFIEFLKSEDVAVDGSYSETWSYIREGTHSLERATNLGLLFV